MICTPNAEKMVTPYMYHNYVDALIKQNDAFVIGEVILPDGSTVTLNSGSTLSYPEKFGRRRVVRLSGEAVFTVTASRRHTFTVETDGMDVTAHGTVFNVRNYPEETAASATLCSGVVKVRKSGGKGHTITLEPDQVLTLEKETGVMTVSGADASEMTSWKEGDLRIKSLPLEQVLKIVEPDHMLIRI